MRLIATFKDEQKAFFLYSSLLNEKIEAVYEPVKNSQGILVEYDVWIVSEDDFERALQIHDGLSTNPNAYLHQDLPKPKEMFFSEKEFSSDQGLGEKVEALENQKRKERSFGPFTNGLILLCVVLFFWVGFERAALYKKSPNLVQNTSFTPLVSKLLFDFPEPFLKLYQFYEKNPSLSKKEMQKWTIKERSKLMVIEKMPYWRGFYDVIVDWPNSKGLLDSPMFVKIREGEYYRILTPLFLHGNLLHLIFNMLWLFLLGKEIERKVGAIRFLILTLMIGAVSNLSQYLMSGPFFIGYSGVICGLAGFIWIRQREAPWEGYRISRGTLGFLFLFVIGMFAIQIVAFALSYLKIYHLPISRLGNSAHLVGLFTGYLLGKIPVLFRLRS